MADKLMQMVERLVVVVIILALLPSLLGAIYLLIIPGRSSVVSDFDSCRKRESRCAFLTLAGTSLIFDNQCFRWRPIYGVLWPLSH